MTKGLIYYSDNRGDPFMLTTVRKQLERVRGDYPLVSVTLGPVEPWFGTVRISLDLERSRLAMFKQILLGLETLDTDIAFLTEHDLIYPADHFAFTPPTNDTYYYNTNTWRVDAKTGQALYYLCQQTSGLCADRLLLVDHYRKRVERTERDGYDHGTGYEPGAHHPPRGIDTIPLKSWRSEVPLVDIRHGCNLTASRWRQDQFRNQKSCQDWQMADEIPVWGPTKGRFREFLEGIGGTA